MLPTILWIEDGAYTELYNMLAPIDVAGCYDLVLAENATVAVEKLRGHQFDAIIVDIRLPPGTAPEWRVIYKNYRESRDSARLGLHLLRALFNSTKAEVALPTAPPSVSSDRVAVFSVETDLQEELAELGIKVYETKNANTPATRVLELIQRVLTQSGYVGHRS